MAKKRTNLWDYLSTLADERTQRVEARNQTSQVKTAYGVDANSIVKDAVSQYGGQVLDLAAAATSAAAGVPLPVGAIGGLGAADGAPSTVDTSAATSPSDTSGLPSWLPWAAGALGLGLLLRRS